MLNVVFVDSISSEVIIEKLYEDVDVESGKLLYMWKNFCPDTKKYNCETYCYSLGVKNNTLDVECRMKCNSEDEGCWAFCRHGMAKFTRRCEFEWVMGCDNCPSVFVKI